MMVSNQQFRLKWNNHRNTVFQEFETLLRNNNFVDCTIGADGKYLKAHKIVLSACSPYLQNVFSEHFDKHPVILLKDVSFKELKCMIDYMYCGEVNISECELPSFLRTAQSLKIKGLAEDINEYDSASDNEHQEISNLTENGRTVEPNVEIHDDEGPPCKKSAPSLIYSNFAGRKRKSPNNTVSSAGKSSNNDKLPSAPITSKLTGGNVPSCVNADNSDSNVCTTGKENSVNKEDANDNSRKNSSQDDHQEHVKSKAEVKEEPVDGDDDNSSYEFGNNPCEDSDPLNEDSESNCANSGKNFTEVSIANVSCNEGEANGYLLSPFQQFQHFEEISVIPKPPVNNFSKSSLYAIKSGCYGPFYCPQCNNHYVWKKNLIRHLKLECGKEPRFQCQACPYKTKHKSSLLIHMKNRHF